MRSQERWTRCSRAGSRLASSSSSPGPGDPGIRGRRPARARTRAGRRRPLGGSEAPGARGPGTNLCPGTGDRTEGSRMTLTEPRQTLSGVELAELDAWWRAANYLSVGQIYLLGDPLLRRPLTRD